MRAVGPHLRASKTADANLRWALPELNKAGRAALIRGVWDNLGRTAAELPHVASLKCCGRGPGWELSGGDHLRRVLADGGPAIFFSAHLANWELVGPVAAACGVHMAGFYRAASNPISDAVILGLRRDARDGADVPMFAKGAAGGREALAHLAGGGFLGVMMDQKMNDGIAVDFFGRPAMTAPALARFALRFDCPVIPIYVERLGPARFRVVCEAPLPPPAASDRSLYIHDMTQTVNRTMERWIRAQPQSWLWLHRRWPADAPSVPKVREQLLD
jgi:KDO2-lipid IV(A) lauroyltransferase